MIHSLIVLSWNTRCKEVLAVVSDVKVGQFKNRILCVLVSFNILLSPTQSFPEEIDDDNDENGTIQFVVSAIEAAEKTAQIGTTVTITYAAAWLFHYFSYLNALRNIKPIRKKGSPYQKTRDELFKLLSDYSDLTEKYSKHLEAKPSSSTPSAPNKTDEWNDEKDSLERMLQKKRQLIIDRAKELRTYLRKLLPENDTTTRLPLLEEKRTNGVIETESFSLHEPIQHPKGEIPDLRRQSDISTAQIKTDYIPDMEYKCLELFTQFKKIPIKTKTKIFSVMTGATVGLYFLKKYANDKLKETTGKTAIEWREHKDKEKAELEAKIQGTKTLATDIMEDPELKKLFPWILKAIELNLGSIREGLKLSETEIEEQGTSINELVQSLRHPTESALVYGIDKALKDIGRSIPHMRQHLSQLSTLDPKSKEYKENLKVIENFITQFYNHYINFEWGYFNNGKGTNFIPDYIPRYYIQDTLQMIKEGKLKIKPSSISPLPAPGIKETSPQKEEARTSGTSTIDGQVKADNNVPISTVAIQNSK